MSRRAQLVLTVVMSALFAATAIVAVLFFVFGGERSPFASVLDPDGGSDTSASAEEDPAENVPPYRIGDDLTLLPTDEGTEPDDEAEKLWSLFSGVAGDRAHDIQGFVVYDAPESDTMAAVWPADDLTTWNAQVNTAWASDEQELDQTLVHEFGHILTLSTGQLDEFAEECPTLQLSYGCAEDGSYVLGFYDDFWADYGADAPTEEGASDDEIAAFFRDNGSFETFVSEYAATSVVEDVAESWAEYVLAENPGYTAEDDSGEQVWSHKLRYFEQFPELVAERDRIRESLGF